MKLQACISFLHINLMSNNIAYEKQFGFPEGYSTFKGLKKAHHKSTLALIFADDIIHFLLVTV